MQCTITNTNVLSIDTEAVHPTTAVALNILEAVSVAIAEPKLNLQRGRWGEAKQYFQRGIEIVGDDENVE